MVAPRIRLNELRLNDAARQRKDPEFERPAPAPVAGERRVGDARSIEEGHGSRAVSGGPATLPRLMGAPGRNRTCDLRFRKPLLYPLSYGGEEAYLTRVV